MNKKYYIPSIEEFHVGFEYEIKDWWTMEGAMGISSNATPEEIEKAKSHIPNTDGFTKRILTKSMLWEQSRTSVKENEHYKAIIKDEEYNPLVGTDWRHEWERITTGIKDGSVRVKYLDKEDIESLGWKYVIPNDGEYTIDNYYSIVKDIPEPNKTTIGIKLRVIGDNTSIWSDDTDATYFDGTIKNKSELKKLMQQISIA